MKLRLALSLLVASCFALLNGNASTAAKTRLPRIQGASSVIYGLAAASASTAASHPAGPAIDEITSSERTNTGVVHDAASSTRLPTITTLSWMPTSDASTWMLTLTVTSENENSPCKGNCVTPTGNVLVSAYGVTYDVVHLPTSGTVSSDLPSWASELTIEAFYQGDEHFLPSQFTLVGKPLVMSAPLSISTVTLSPAVTGTAYRATLQAAGGTTPYTWTLLSGNLPAGLTLAPSTGIITGIPTAAGAFDLTVQVADASSPIQRASAATSIAVTNPPPILSISSSTLLPAVTGTTYSATFQAAGGTTPYTWTMLSGSLPAGLTLAPSTGIVTGTPTAAGAFSLTVQVADAGSPTQRQSATTSITVTAPPPPSSGTTWYVRPDGGTRYSSLVTAGQCDGMGDAPYPGTGTDQHCAFNDVRYFWQDGSYTNATTFPAYGWVGSGGDTYLIRGSIGSGAPGYREGWNNGTSSFDPATNQYWGVAGDNGYGPPVPLAGTAANHTKILGENYASCHTPGAKTPLFGGFGLYVVLDLRGASYVDVACLDISDHSNCGNQNAPGQCSTYTTPVLDFANNGIFISNTSNNFTLTDVKVHGLETGMRGPNGPNFTASYVEFSGNSSSGWNADDGTLGIGSALVQNYNISWNGCAEEYPIVDALPYSNCQDDNSNGYGDGFGTASINGTVAWNIHFDQGTVSYNTQDGLDALHLVGPGSSMSITRTLAYGNMGQQIKIGGASSFASNNVIVTNCNALREAIPGTPAGYNSSLSDFCRAADAGLLFTVVDGATTVFDNNTVYSANATAVEIECQYQSSCTGTDLIDFRNNIFFGFANNTANGYPGGGSGDYPSPVYSASGAYPFTNPGSFYSNNVTYRPKSNWTCPAVGEANAICADPQLTDETWHLYGYGDMTPVSGSVVKGAGVAVPAVTTDYSGEQRTDPPTIGAYQ